MGNIGEEYRGTRHNIGFMILDALAEESNISFSTMRYGDVGKGRFKNQEVILLKPSTYMNLSGNAVRYWKEQENIELDNILVVVDDISLPVGAIRIKTRGSDAGHNGLKNIAQMLGTESYPRLRFGVGNDFPRGTQIDYVLGHFPTDEQPLVRERIGVAVDAIRECVLAGLGNAMCKYNNK